MASRPPDDDRQTVEDARRGDTAAYTRLVRSNEEIAFRTAYLITRNAADAEEAAQDGFAKAFRALGRFRSGAPFRRMVPFAGKVIGPNGRIESLEFDGRPAVWITGAPHVVRFFDETGQFHESRSRIAGDVLLWQDGDVTLRLEGRLTRNEAVALARTIR